MTRLLNLTRSLGDLAENGTDSDIHHALELCYAFMERIEEERLASQQSLTAPEGSAPQPSSRFVN